MKKELAKLESLERVPTPVKEMDARFYGSIEEAYVSLDAIEKLNKEWVYLLSFYVFFLYPTNSYRAVPLAPKLNDAMQGLIIKNYMHMTRRENVTIISMVLIYIFIIFF